MSTQPDRQSKFLSVSVFAAFLAAFLSCVPEARAAGWENVGSAGFSPGTAGNTMLVFNPSTNQPYVSFVDGANGNKATVMRFDGTNWVAVGSAGFSAGTASYLKLAFNPSTNEPYVAFQDGANGSKATVMRFDGTNWVVVGSAGFSTGNVVYTSLAFNSSTNEPYVLYTDYAYSLGPKIVKRYDGSNWVDVGTMPLSNSQGAQEGVIAFNPSTNQPYVVYKYLAGTVYARYFDGSAWALLDGSYVANYSYDFSLAFNSGNQPCIAYRDDNRNAEATMRCYNGSGAWNLVGPIEFSPGEAYYTSLAFDPSTNRPYVAYQDAANSNKASAMYFDGSSWQTAGTAGFSAGAVVSTSLAFNPAINRAYVAYVDGGNSNKASVMRYMPPLTISGVADAQVYLSGVTPTISGGTGTITTTLNGSPYVSGTPITTDGSYTLSTQDDYSNLSISFEVIQSVVIPNPAPSNIQNSVTKGLVTLAGTINSATQATFNIPHTLSSSQHEVIFPTGVQMSKTGGGSFDFSTLDIEDTTTSAQSELPDMEVAGAVRMGATNSKLSFSSPATLKIHVGSGLNGETLQVVSKSFGDTGWSTEGTCTVVAGMCVFYANHATDYAAGSGTLDVQETSFLTFDLGATIALDCDDTVTISTVVGSGRATIGDSHFADCTVTTNNSDGYKLQWQASAADMVNGTGDHLLPYTPAASTTPETWFVPNTLAEWGAKLAATSEGYNGGSGGNGYTYPGSGWGSGDTYANGKFLNVAASSPFQIMSKSSETDANGEIQSVMFTAEVGQDMIQATGTYTVDVTITATTL